MVKSDVKVHNNDINLIITAENHATKILTDNTKSEIFGNKLTIISISLLITKIRDPRYDKVIFSD